MEDILKYIKTDQFYDLHKIIPTAPGKKQIIGWEKSKSDQIWTRPYQLTDGQFLRLSHSEQQDIVETENDRCLNGVWFYNFGEPIFLTGDNYNFLTYYKMEGHIIPEFMKFQSATFYFYLYAELERSVYGTLELKPRREGCTHRKLSIALNRAIMNESFLVGIQSKTGDDAEKMNFDNAVKAFNKYPCWRKPKSKLLNPSKELAFEQPPKRETGKIKSIAEIEYEDFYLNSKIDWRSTSSDAYDGKKLQLYILDEFWKWQEANAAVTLSTVKKCIVDGEDIKGVIFVLSTVGIDEKEETVSEEAFLTGLEMWKEADPHQRNLLGETENGLLRLFIPAYKSRRGTSRLTNTVLLDKYGNVNEEEAKLVLLAKREATTDPKKKMIFIRQEPMNVQEAISSFMSGGSTFDNIRLGERLSYLDNFVPTDLRPVKYRVGNLAWKDNERFTEVVFNDNPNGRWCIPYMPTIDGIDMKNKVKKLSNGGFAPFSDTPFCIGADMFNYSKTVSGDGSKGMFHAKHKWKNLYCCHYLFRPASPDLYHEDILLTAWFFGAKVNPERSGSDVFNWFKRNGVYSFIMNRPDVTKNSAFTKGDTEKGTTPSPANVELGCNLIENYLALPNEEENENVVDNLDFFWHEETLRQLMSFDIKKREKSDAVMAMIHTEIGCQSIKKFASPFRETGKDQRTIVDELFPQYVIKDGKRIAMPRSQINNHNGFPKQYPNPR